jgi:hypothetical protein
MTERLLTDAEASEVLDADGLERAAVGVVLELLDPYGDQERYRSTVVALARVPRTAKWWIDLMVAAEMFANNQPMREPLGFRVSQ